MVVKISDFVEIKFIGIYAPVERQARGGERNRQTGKEAETERDFGQWPELGSQ